MNLVVVAGEYSICRMSATSKIPHWVPSNGFYSITKSVDELSIVCETKNVPLEVKSENNWGLLKVEGPLNFKLTGVLYSIAKPLAENNISIFVVSTFDTDYLLIKADKISTAKNLLMNVGFHFL